MLNCAPIEVVTTLEFLKRVDFDKFDRFCTFLSKQRGLDHFYVHWQSVVNWLKDSSIRNNTMANNIAELWEMDFIRPIPDADELAELPAILHLSNDIHPDNVRVYCGTFGEYVELRKHFGKEDVKY